MCLSEPPTDTVEVQEEPQEGGTEEEGGGGREGGEQERAKVEDQPQFPELSIDEVSSVCQRGLCAKGWRPVSDLLFNWLQLAPPQMRRRRLEKLGNLGNLPLRSQTDPGRATQRGGAGGGVQSSSVPDIMLSADGKVCTFLQAPQSGTVLPLPLPARTSPWRWRQRPLDCRRKLHPPPSRRPRQPIMSAQAPSVPIRESWQRQPLEPLTPPPPPASPPIHSTTSSARSSRSHSR